ncbi:hypothetical protein Tco_0791428 [Tanacetum coccineum]
MVAQGKRFFGRQLSVSSDPNENLCWQSLHQELLLYFCLQETRTRAGEFTVDAVLDKQLVLEGCPEMPLDTCNAAATKQTSSTDENMPGTPPHYVIDVVARTIVTTVFNFASNNERSVSFAKKEHSSSESEARDTKATAKRPLLPQSTDLARKNELNARGTLLMALPNEHQLKFNTYKSAKTLMEAIEKRFRGSSSTNQNTQNVAFVSSNITISTNEAVMTAHSVSAANSKNNASTLPNVDSLSNVMIYSFFANQGGMHNFHRRCHFSRECMTPKNQDSRKKETTRRIVPVEETTSNALVSQCDGFGYDWSDQAEEGPTNFVLLAYTSSSSSSLDTEVSTCSKACLISYETLKEHYDNLTKDFNKSQLNVGTYKAGLESVEARLDVYKKNEVVFKEDIKILKLDIMLRDNALTELRKNLKKLKKERYDLKLTLEKFENSSKNLRKLLDSQICDKFNSGVGYKTSEGYHVVPPPYTGNFMPPKPDLVLADKDEYVFSESVTSVSAIATSKVKTSESKPKSVSEPLIKDWISDSENENEIEFKSRQRKPSNAKVKFVKSNEHVKSPRKSVKKVENYKQAEYPRKNCQSPRVFNHLIKDCDYYEKKMVEKPMWNNARKIQVSDGLGPKETNFLTILCRESQQDLKDKGGIDSGTKACDDAGKARVETIPGKDYILLPLWPQDPQFSSSSKNFPNVGFKPSGEEEKKDAEDLENKYSEVPSTEEPRVNQEKDANINSTNNFNIVSPTVNAAGIEDNVVDENIVYGCADDPNMPNLEEIIYSDDDEDNDAEADMNNLNTIMFVSPIPTTRLHKDHPLEQIIGDIHSAP